MSAQGGQLRNRITIKRQSDVSDGKGGFNRAWTVLDASVPASVHGLSGKEALIGHTIQGISSFEILVRFRTDIKPADQILFNGQELNVIASEDRDGRRAWTYITATTEGPQGA